MKKPLRTLPPACGVSLSRRKAVRRVGEWVIYLGAVSVAACGRTPLGDPIGEFIGTDDDDDVATSPTPVISPTPTPLPCTCSPVSGALAGLNISALPLDHFAVNAGQKLFLCHDTDGFYAMSDLCTHAGTHMIDNGSFNVNNLSGGFTCNLHGSKFDGNGMRTGPPAPLGSYLTHYLLTIDAGGEIYFDVTKIVDHDCRCTP